MSLPAGTKLGPYEIVAPIGAGGMGEVCRMLTKSGAKLREVAHPKDGTAELKQ